MLKTLIVGPLAVNCYVLSCDETGECVVVDPGDEGERILAFLDGAGLRCRWVIDTHGHADHVGANAAVVAATKAPLAIHPSDRFLLERAVSMALSLGMAIGPLPRSGRGARGTRPSWPSGRNASPCSTPRGIPPAR